MPIIRDNKYEENSWVTIADDVSIPDGGDVIISLERLKGLDAGEAFSRSGRIGVAVENYEDIQELGPWLTRLDLVQLSFPAFTDGRAYSQARILRTQLAFEGDIRATGDVLADQAHLMERCGFSSFEASQVLSLEIWEQVTSALNYSYQRGYELKTTESRGRSSEQNPIPVVSVNETIHV